MAELDDKVEMNVEGKYYVDSSCIDCDLCRESAPQFFGRDEDEGVSYVCAQPTTPEDIALCDEVLESCPVQSIGDDGDE